MQAVCALACALCCLHSWELLAPLGFDSQGSYKMPYFLAVSLFKNKNGFTRPWSSCCLSLVTPSFPGASAAGSPSALPSPKRSTLSPLLSHSWLCLPIQQGPRRLPTLFPNLLPNELLRLHPSNLVGAPLCVSHPGFCSDQMADFPVPLSSCSGPLPTQDQGSFPKHKPDLALPCFHLPAPSHCN